MPVTRSASLLCLVMAAIASAAHSAEPGSPAASTAQAPPADVAIPNTRRLEFVSKVNGHRYSISIAMPFEPAPQNGYGVLYVLDGYAYFASAAEAVRGPDKAPGVVVVGIGYPDDPMYARQVIAQRGPIFRAFEGLPSFRAAPYLERFYDLTLPTSDESLRQMGFGQYRSQNFGGLSDFLRIIETEVKPRVAELTSIDHGNQAIFGHSLGGYAVLHALFAEPNSFRTYIIASPSIFWDHKAVLIDEGRFAAAVRAGRASPRVFVTMGSEESTSPDIPARWAMVENGRELVRWLRSLHGSTGYVVDEYAIFAKTTHSFSPWPALARGVSFAFPGVHTNMKEDPDRTDGTTGRPDQ